MCCFLPSLEVLHGRLEINNLSIFDQQIRILSTENRKVFGSALPLIEKAGSESAWKPMRINNTAFLRLRLIPNRIPGTT
jgi:hypothetical protein